MNPSFYIGVVEDRFDPKKLGRARVRVMGLHTFDKTVLPTADLPWAYKIQQTTSGAISGVGHAPVGVVEGTWVAVQYIDPDKQMPFIVGTFGGIPQVSNPGLESFSVEPGTTDSTNVPTNALRTEDGTVVTDGSGEPITTGEEPKPPTTDPEWKAKVTKRLGELESTNNYKAVNQLNYLGKYQFGAAALTDRGYIKKGTSNRGLDDPANWTGKDGIRSKEDFLNSQSVQEKVMSENIDANYKTMKRIGIPLDTMSDADKAGYVASAHLYGAGGAKNLYNGVVKADANGTTTKKYFAEGHKAVSGTTPEAPPQNNTVQRPQEVAKQNKESIKQEPPTSEQKVGYKNKVIPFKNDQVGFKDPSQTYPLETHLNEPDTNRLARHEKIGQTIVFSKENSKHTGVAKANGKGSWDQSPIPYNAQYPFNNVWQSESGHLLEFDDTPGKERTHFYHAKGTFTEVDHNGTQVNFIVGDNYVIMERNGKVHVVGSLDVKVDGAHTLLVEGNTDVQVNGNATINIHSSAKINVARNLDITAGGSIMMKAGGRFAVDASRIDLNSGVASGLATIGSIGASTSEAGALNVSTRGEELAINYEVLSDDPAEYEAFKKVAVQEGILTEEQVAAKPDVTEKADVPPNKAEEKPVPPVSKQTFDCNEKLSKHYTLGDLTAGCTRKLRDQAGLTAEQIYNNLRALAINVLDPLKDRYPNMKINSCLRIDNGKSQHNKGEAVDVSFPGLSRSDLFDRVKQVQQQVPYDQMILEYLTPGGNGWIHISYKQGGLRNQAFTMNNHARVGSMGTFSRVA
jgi:hypothetical protein